MPLSNRLSLFNSILGNRLELRPIAARRQMTTQVTPLNGSLMISLPYNVNKFTFSHVKEFNKDNLEDKELSDLKSNKTEIFKKYNLNYTDMNDQAFIEELKKGIQNYLIENRDNEGYIFDDSKNVIKDNQAVLLIQNRNIFIFDFNFITTWHKLSEINPISKIPFRLNQLKAINIK